MHMYFDAKKYTQYHVILEVGKKKRELLTIESKDYDYNTED